MPCCWGIRIMLIKAVAMTPQEVQERLKLSQLKDKIWYVVPSCATNGEGLFEGLVSTFLIPDYKEILMCLRAGYQTTSRHHRNDKPDRLTLIPLLSNSDLFHDTNVQHNTFSP